MGFIRGSGCGKVEGSGMVDLLVQGFTRAGQIVCVTEVSGESSSPQP